jgi:hypothetical protein
MSRASEIEQRLRAHTLPVIEPWMPDGEFIMPHYHGLGIANVPATVAALFGGELPGACPPLERELWTAWGDGLRRVILVIVDALGYLQVQAAMERDPTLAFNRLAEVGTLVPIASTFPSTTNNVLSTLWTGYSPAAHGILAYELYLREIGVAASTLFFWPISYRKRDILAEWGLDPEKFVPVPGLAQQLAAQGVLTRGFISKAYSESMLSQIHRRGTQAITPFISGGDMWLGLQQTIEQHVMDKMLVVAYWDTIDGITHQYGPDNAAWDLELRGISAMMETGFLARLTKEQKKGTLLLITADHGGITTPPSVAIRLEDHPDLREALSLPPLGESRAPFWHVRGHALSSVQRYLQERLGETLITLTAEQVLESGLLGPGPVYAETPHRLGDLVSLARGSHYLARNQYQLKLLGRHGGLTAQEMLVPLLGVRLDWM